MSDYHGLRAVVTGAGGIIGTAVCQRLVRSGIDTLFALDQRWKEEDRDDRAELMSKLGQRTTPNIFRIGVDLSSKSEVDQVASERIIPGIDRIHMLICVAGGSLPGDKDIPTPEMLHATIDRNVITVTNIFGALIEQLMLGRAGVALTGSINGVTGMGQDAYAASKAALGAFAKVWGVRYGYSGVRVNCIHLGTVIDPHNLNARWEERFKQDPEIFKQIGKKIPRFNLEYPILTPEEAAAALCWYASPENTIFNAQEPVADSGFTASVGCGPQIRTGSDWWKPAG